MALGGSRVAAREQGPHGLRSEKALGAGRVLTLWRRMQEPELERAQGVHLQDLAKELQDLRAGGRAPGQRVRRACPSQQNRTLSHSVGSRSHRLGAAAPRPWSPPRDAALYRALSPPPAPEEGS